MKKYLLVLFTCLLLVGCSKKIEKFYLTDKYYGNSSLVDITKEEVKKLENNKESFGVLVYSSGCTSCSLFGHVVQEFLQKENIEVYSISGLDIDGTKIKEKVKYFPSFVIYHDGEIVDYLDANSDSDLPYYKSSGDFEKWFTNYVLLK